MERIWFSFRMDKHARHFQNSQLRLPTSQLYLDCERYQRKPIPIQRKPGPVYRSICFRRKPEWSKMELDLWRQHFFNSTKSVQNIQHRGNILCDPYRHRQSESILCQNQRSAHYPEADTSLERNSAQIKQIAERRSVLILTKTRLFSNFTGWNCCSKRTTWLK